MDVRAVLRFVRIRPLLAKIGGRQTRIGRADEAELSRLRVEQVERLRILRRIGADHVILARLIP